MTLPFRNTLSCRRVNWLGETDTFFDLPSPVTQFIYVELIKEEQDIAGGNDGLKN